MNDFYKQDIFFFVTTIAVVVVSILLAVLIIYLIKVFKDIKYISGKAKTEADLLSEDLSQLRKDVKEGGAKIRYFSRFFNSVYKRNKK